MWVWREIDYHYTFTTIFFRCGGISLMWLAQRTKNEFWQIDKADRFAFGKLLAVALITIFFRLFSDFCRNKYSQVSRIRIRTVKFLGLVVFDYALFDLLQTYGVGTGTLVTTSSFAFCQRYRDTQCCQNHYICLGKYCSQNCLCACRCLAFVWNVSTFPETGDRGLIISDRTIFTIVTIYHWITLWLFTVNSE